MNNQFKIEKHYTYTGFKINYKNDIIEIYKILIKHLSKNFVINDREKLLKVFFEYVYKTSNVSKLND